MPARYTAADYAGAARALLPRGRVWPTDADSVQTQLLAALGKTFERSDAAASVLLDGSLPGNDADLLDAWEASLGLPDPCAGPDPTDQQRGNQIRARFIAGGGQSRERYVEYAATLGFTIVIENFAPFRTGRSTVGNPLASDAWTFVWGVRVLANATDLSLDVLICELETIKPAETTIILLS